MTWYTDLTIGGKALAGEGPALEVVNPANEELLTEIPMASVEQLDEAVSAARSTFDSGVWSRWDKAERGRAMHRFADVLEANADELLRHVVSECGSPVSLRALQIDGPIGYARWCAEQATYDHDIQFPLQLDPWPNGSVVAYRPIGVIGSIAAYNYPLTLTLVKVAAAMAAGCTTVLMPSPQTPLTALLLGKLAEEADLPAGLLNVVVGGADIAHRLTVSPGVDKVSFTGSVAVGSKVAQQAASEIKGVVLELGGKNPNIILPDVEFAPIIDAVHARYLRNAGQGCGSPTRILVDEPRLDEFLELSREAYGRVAVGDPWDPKTITGPVISRAHRDRVLGYVQSALDDGGTIAAGGEKAPFEKGFWVMPTLISGVPHSAKVCQEEIFGPVAVVIPYRDVEDAVQIANDTEYGLGASIYSGRLDVAFDMASRIHGGAVTINGGGGFRPEVANGGMKKSGIGREFGLFGIKEFLEPQHISWKM